MAGSVRCALLAALALAGLLRHGAFTIIFRRPQGRTAVTIANPTIFAGSSLARRARRHRVGRLAVGLNATDSRKFTSRYTVRLRLRT